MKNHKVAKHLILFSDYITLMISADLNHFQTAACFKSAASTSASFILFGDRLSQGFAEMDEASGQLCLLQYRSIFLQTDSIKVENLLFSAVSFSHRKRQKQQPDGTCLLHSFIISSTWCTMASARSDLAAFT